jgi:hypothetical protein
MQQPSLDQIIPELVERFGEALALVVSAIARQGDAEKLHAELQSRISAATSTRMASPMAIHLATLALAGIEAVRLENQADKQNQAKH